MIPVLETARLVLRAHTLDDVADASAMWADPDVTRFIGGRPFSAEEVWARVCRYLGHWDLLGFGYFAVHDKSAGRFVGEVGLADFRRDMQPSLHGAPELGYALASWAHGQSFATEACRALLAWADDKTAAGDPRFARTVCMIDPPHVASAKVAHKLGYRHAFHGAYKGEPVVVLQRTHPSAE